MQKIRLADWQRDIEARKRELGILQTPEQNAALRNPGDRRTPEKRELLRRIAARSAAATPAKP